VRPVLAHEAGLRRRSDPVRVRRLKCGDAPPEVGQGDILGGAGEGKIRLPRPSHILGREPRSEVFQDQQAQQGVLKVVIDGDPVHALPGVVAPRNCPVAELRRLGNALPVVPRRKSGAILLRPGAHALHTPPFDGGAENAAGQPILIPTWVDVEAPRP